MGGVQLRKFALHNTGDAPEPTCGVPAEQRLSFPVPKGTNHALCYYEISITSSVIERRLWRAKLPEGLMLRMLSAARAGRGPAPLLVFLLLTTACGQARTARIFDGPVLPPVVTLT